ncbi:unnamed protein product [Brassica oleracea]
MLSPEYRSEPISYSSTLPEECHIEESEPPRENHPLTTDVQELREIPPKLTWPSCPEEVFTALDTSATKEGMLSLNPDSKKPSYIGTSPALKSETVSKGPGIRITRSSGRWNFILQNFTSSSPITDTGPTGGSPLLSGSDVASPMAAFLISSISADTPKADPEELIDSQASSLWYINLPTRSISSFASLSDKFVEQFASSRSLEKTSDGLYEVLQHRVEPL